MPLVKTRNNLIYVAYKTAPSFGCVGKCQKVWWDEDMENRIEAAAEISCPQCGGKLEKPIPEGHYQVVVDDCEPLKNGQGMVIKNLSLNVGGKK